MKNLNLNEINIKEIAIALKELNEKAVFVGGSVVGFYSNDQAAEDIRPTKDVDVSIEIFSILELEEVRKTLNKYGFHHDSDLICRFKYKEIIVNIMGRKEIGWASSNKWFDLGFNHLEEKNLGEVKIRILSFPYFLASKFEAFKSRGINEPKFSKDFEDIVYLLDTVFDFSKKIISAPLEVRAYLINCLIEIKNDSTLKETLLSQLYYTTQLERFEAIMEKINSVIVN